MKEKKLKKIIKSVLEEMRKYDIPIALKEDTDINRCEYDAEVSSKFKKMILNLINYKENLSMSVDESRIAISASDISSIKKANHRNGGLIKEDDFIEIMIRKDIGFDISRGYRMKSSYQDKEMYSELVEEVKTKLKDLNSENFNNIWTDVMKESGVLRDNNLNEIFGNG